MAINDMTTTGDQRAARPSSRVLRSDFRVEAIKSADRIAGVLEHFPDTRVLAVLPGPGETASPVSLTVTQTDVREAGGGELPELPGPADPDLVILKNWIHYRTTVDLLVSEGLVELTGETHRVGIFGQLALEARVL